VKVGSQPSGLAVDRTGWFALVANRDGKSISVLRIDGQDVAVTDTIAMGDVVTSVAITPNGKRALAVKFAVHKVALLSIGADGTVTYDKRDLPVGLFPWTVAMAPSGERAFVTNIGANAASDGNAKTVSVIDLKSEPPRVVQHVSVGDAPEGVAVSPNGRMAAVTILQGSYDAPKGAWWHNGYGLLTFIRVDPKGVRVSENVNVEAFPEGVAFSADSRFVYVGNFASSSLSIIELDASGKALGQRIMKLPGPAASLRIGSQ
jgi:DNA-binding beta-propeller fold protein YncE